MEKYLGLINPSKLKQEFVISFLSVFSTAKKLNTQKKIATHYTNQMTTSIKVMSLKSTLNLIVGV